MKVRNEKKEQIRKLILKAPIWSDKEFLAYQDARNHFNKSRLKKESLNNFLNKS